MTNNWKKALIYIIGAIATALGILFGVTSCTATRTISTEAQTINKGDTIVNITTKTIESYTGKKY